MKKFTRAADRADSSEQPTRGRRGRVVVATLLAATAGIIAVPQSASAAKTDCPEGRFCIWTEPNYVGHRASFAVSAPNLANPINGYVFNDATSSVYNHTNRSWCVYRDSGRRVVLFGAHSGDYRDNLRIDGYDNMISSIYPC